MAVGGGAQIMPMVSLLLPLASVVLLGALAGALWVPLGSLRCCCLGPVLYGVDTPNCHLTVGPVVSWPPSPL